MQRFRAEDLKNTYSPYHDVYGRVRSGETFVVETEDGYGGRLRNADSMTAETLAWIEDNMDVVTGPIWVEGAQPGDVVAVEILGMEITSAGSVPIGPHAAPSPDDWWSERRHPTTVTIRDGAVLVGDGLRIPVRPVIGCIATAPKHEVILSRHEGTFGGNQDCNTMTVGSTVVLPVNREGAFLYFGDCKARMADGEIAQAPEVAALITARATVRPGPASMTWPRVESASHISTVVSDINLGDACRQAFRELMLWLEEDTGAPRETIATVMAMMADTAVCQVSNQLHTARCTIERWTLDALASATKGEAVGSTP